MSWMGGWFDPELEELFHDDPELLETAKRVHASRPQSEPDPRFQNRLRGQLLAEASRGGARAAPLVAPRTRSLCLGRGGRRRCADRRDRAHVPVEPPPDQTITAISDLTAQHSVNPNKVIRSDSTSRWITRQSRMASTSSPRPRSPSPGTATTW